MRFLLNMNVSRQIGRALEELGQEWQHAREVGLAKASDKDVVEFAAPENRVIITNDLDYADLLMLRGDPRPSAIIFRLRLSAPTRMCQRLEDSWGVIQEPLRQGAIVVIEDAAIRIRPFSEEPA